MSEFKEQMEKDTLQLRQMMDDQRKLYLLIQEKHLMAPKKSHSVLPKHKFNISNRKMH